MYKLTLSRTYMMNNENRIPRIKAIRELTGFGLKDAKDLSDRLDVCHINDDVTVVVPEMNLSNTKHQLESLGVHIDSYEPTGTYAKLKEVLLQLIDDGYFNAAKDVLDAMADIRLNGKKVSDADQAN